MSYIILLIGFGLLVKGADYFVEGSSEIASALKIPPILIGLTVVAFGTSSPEAAVSITAALKGNGDITLGNVIGSNIFNITFIIGVTAFINPLKVERETIRKEIPLAFLGSVILIILMADIKLQGSKINLLTRGDGLIFLSFFSIFLYYIFEVAAHSREKMGEENNGIEMKRMGLSITYTIGGLGGIVFGGELVVRSSTQIAYALGMSQALVGLTIVAVGTSLPELITSITAAMKKKSEIALGNIVGSNIFNILFILGISSVISPISVDGKMFLDTIIMIITMMILLGFSKTQGKISKIEGVLLASGYLVYMAYIIIRN